MAVHRSAYKGDDDITIVLEVPEPPMGMGSGFIPPPTITFFKDGNDRAFYYQGEAD